jgi:hypothetical protein
MYDQKLWNAGGFIEPLTIRSAVEIGVQVAGVVLTAMSGGALAPLMVLAVYGLNMADDLLFATLDSAFTNKCNKEVWGGFGTKAATSAVTSAMSFGIGSAGQAVSGVMQGASGFAQGAAQFGITAAGTYTTTVAVNYASAFDFSSWTFNEARLQEAHRSWGSADTIAGALGAGVTAGLTTGINAINTGQNGINLLGFSELNKRDVGSLNNLIGGLAGQGVEYAMGGNFSLNVLNLGLFTGGKYNSGLLELHLGRGGVSMNFGTGGANVSVDNIAASFRGAQVWNVNNQISRYGSKNEFDALITLRAQYGYGDNVQRNQLRDILRGDTVLYTGSEGGYRGLTDMVNGQRVVSLTGYRQGMSEEEQFLLAVVLGHEAHRDGIVTADNYLETRTAVFAHTEMALRMITAGEAIAFDRNLANDIAAYYQGNSRFNAYVDATYDSSADYWKVRLDNDNGEWRFQVQKDQETDNIYELADRLFGIASDADTEQVKYNFIKDMIEQNNGSVELAMGTMLDLSGYIGVSRDYGRMGHVFNASGAAEYLYETLGSDFSDTKFVSWVFGGSIIPETVAQAIPSLSNRTIGYNSRSVDPDLPGNTAMTFDAFSIAAQFGFGIDESLFSHNNYYSSSHGAVELLFHENFHNHQYDVMGVIPFLLRYAFEAGAKDNYEWRVGNWRLDRMTLECVVNNPVGRSALLPTNGVPVHDNIRIMNRGHSNDLGFVTVRTTLDSRADVFGYYAATDYYDWFNSRYKR